MLSVYIPKKLQRTLICACICFTLLILYINHTSDYQNIVSETDTAVFTEFLNTAQIAPLNQKIIPSATGYTIIINTDTHKKYTLQKDTVFDANRNYYGLFNDCNEVLCEKFIPKET